MSKKSLNEVILVALERANKGSQYQPLSAAMVDEFAGVIAADVRDFLAQVFALKDEIESRQIWIQITGEPLCKCSQLQRCETCRHLCNCDEGMMCGPCRAKREPTRAELEAEFGRLPSRRSLFERLPEIRACEKCKIVLVGEGRFAHNDVRICSRHRIKFLAENQGEVDQGACEHVFDPDEGFMCLNCGKEGAEEILSRAADEAKDRRKYDE